MLARVMLDWVFDNKTLVTWLFIGSAVMFVGGLLLVPVFVVRMPADFFTRPRRHAARWSGHHPGVRLLLFVLKNVVGAVLVAVGIAMLFIPGQGVLTILVGVGFLEFPGKRRLELWLVRLPKVLDAINWLRERRGHAPLDGRGADEAARASRVGVAGDGHARGRRRRVDEAARQRERREGRESREPTTPPSHGGPPSL